MLDAAIHSISRRFTDLNFLSFQRVFRASDPDCAAPQQVAFLQQNLTELVVIRRKLPNQPGHIRLPEIVPRPGDSLRCASRVVRRKDACQGIASDKK